MKKRLLLALLPGLLALRAGVLPVRADSAGGDVAPTQLLQPAELRSDFDLLRHALEEAHAGLYRYSTKSEMDHAFDARRAALDHPMTRLQFQAVVARTLAFIHCGHTSINRDAAMDAAFKEARTFPLRVLLEGRRLTVVLNETADDRTIRPGMEIVRVNGRTAGEIIDAIAPLISADGDIETGKSHDLSGPFAQFYRWLIEQPDEFTVEATDADGHDVTTKLPGVTDAQRKANHNPVNDAMNAGIAKAMNRPRENLDLQFVKDHPDVAVIRMRFFFADHYSQWMEQTFKTLRDKGTKSLIIDVRGNGGGPDLNGAMLVGFLTDKPFRYFERINMKTITPSFKDHSDFRMNDQELTRFRAGLTPDGQGGYLLTPALHKGLEEQKPKENAFLGKVFVLTDGGTFSTAADFCAIVRNLKRATFIGEETGGGYAGNNSGMMPDVTLPNSKIRFRLPMYEYWNAVDGDEHACRHGVIPDHVVPFTTAAVLRGEDEAMNLAIKLASER